MVEDRSPGADLRLPAEPVTVSVDAVTFDRILGNLLDNAGRHGRRPVEVSLSSAEGVARVTVADSGPGVPPTNSNGYSIGSPSSTPPVPGREPGWVSRSPGIMPVASGETWWLVQVSKAGWLSR